MTTRDALNLIHAPKNVICYYDFLRSSATSESEVISRMIHITNIVIESSKRDEYKLFADKEQQDFCIRGNTGVKTIMQCAELAGLDNLPPVNFQLYHGTGLSVSQFADFIDTFTNLLYNETLKMKSQQSNPS